MLDNLGTIVAIVIVAIVVAVGARSTAIRARSTRHRRTLRAAFDTRSDVLLRYVDKGGEETERQLTPQWIGAEGQTGSRTYGKAKYRDDGRYFGGYCHLRLEPRTFRLDRIRSLEAVEAAPKKRTRSRRP